MAKYIKSILILAIGLGLAYWFISRLEWQLVGTHLKHARIWPLVLAAVVINLTLLARSLRWKALLTPISPARLRNLFAATSIGFGMIFILGRVVGELIRPAALSLSEKLRPTATFATILIERIFDTTMVVSLFAVNLLFIQLPGNHKELPMTRSIGLFLLISVVFGIVGLVLLRLKAVPIIGWIERISSHLPRKVIQPLLNFLRHLAEGLVVLTDLRLLVTTVFYTACVWGMVSVATWFTLYSFDLRFPISYIIFVLGFGMVGSVVPTPGGSAGAFHAAAAKSLEFLGLEPNLAASVAIIHHLIAFGPPFLIALYFLVRDDISLGQIRELIASEDHSDSGLPGKIGLSNSKIS